MGPSKADACSTPDRREVDLMNRSTITTDDLRADDLRALGTKYERMMALRIARSRSRTDPSYVEPDPRPAMAKLAEDFPGALRELDRLPLSVIAARLDALEAAAEDLSRAEPWMLAQVTFHDVARAALFAKRWLAGRKQITEHLRSEFARVSPPNAVNVFGANLEHVANPPRGRVMDVVLAEVAKILGIDEVEAWRLAFGETGTSRRPP